MDGQSPRHQSTVKVNGQWSTVKGVRSVNLLNLLVFGPGQKGQRGQTLGFRRDRKGQKGQLPGQRGQEWSKVHFDYFGGWFIGNFAFSESIQLRFSRVSSQFRLSRRSGSNHALRFSC
jgi:hypothetical protein